MELLDVEMGSSEESPEHRQKNSGHSLNFRQHDDSGGHGFVMQPEEEALESVAHARGNAFKSETTRDTGQT